MILVFGGGGQLATELAGLARTARVPLASLTHAEADIAEPADVARAFAKVRPTAVINAAAYNAVDRAESEPEAAMRTNATGPGVIAAACARAGVPMLHVSTDYVFDGEKASAYVEDDPVHPLGAYGRSKAAGEAAVRAACSHHAIVRTAWVFGTHGNNFLKTMLRLARERDRIDVVADQRGSPTLTVDLAQALLAIVRASGAGKQPWGTYHFAGRGGPTRHAFAARIIEAQRPFTGRAPVVNPIATADYPTPAVRPKNSVLDSTKFSQVFGFRSTDWRDAVDHTVAALFAAKAPA